MPERRIKGLIVYSNIGSGFKSPAESIEKELRLLGADTKSCDFLAALNSKLLDRIGKNSWKLMLENPLIFEFLFNISNSQLIVPVLMVHDIATGKAIEQLASEKPDFIFSTYPIATEFYSRLVKRKKLSIPVFGYNSDVILSHKAYISNAVLKYFVSSGEGYDAMLKQGQLKEKLILSGFPLDRKYRKKFGSLRRERKKLGLKDKFTLLLMLGGEGIGPLESVISAIIESGLDIQVIAICGRNEKLMKHLEDLGKYNPGFDLVVVGFVSNVEEYLYCCNLAGGKSGLNFVFESIFMKKPFIVLKAMVNEKFAAQLIVRKGIGWWPRNINELISILKSAQERRYLGRRIANMRKLDYSFHAEEIASRVIDETAAYRQKNLMSRACLLFDLAGTLCDVPIDEKNWWRINYRGIENVLKHIEVDRILTSAEFRQACTDFVREKARLRALAKKTLTESDVKQQLRDFFKKLSRRHGRLEAMLGEGSIGTDKLAFLEELFIRTELDISSLFRGAGTLLEQLSKKRRLYLLCNNVSSLLVERILEKEKISGYFRKVFVSADIGVRKPHEAFMQHCLKEIGAGRSDCIFIGDRLNQDMAMANRAGIPCIYTTLRAHEDNEGADAFFDYEAGSISELEKILFGKLEGNR